MTTTPTTDRSAAAAPGPGTGRQSAGARCVRATGSSAAMTVAAGVLVLLIMAGIAVFLVWKAVPALRVNTVDFLTYQKWFPDQAQPAFGIAAVVFGTVTTAVIAMILAVPVGYGIALFTAHYAPRRVAAPLGYLVDLLAAVPSIIYGLWGLEFLMPRSIGLFEWLNDHLGFIPIFDNRIGVYTRSHRARLDRARDHDPADGVRDQPRGVPAGAARPHRGGARARRDPLGDGPHRGDPVRRRPA